MSRSDRRLARVAAALFVVTMLMGMVDAYVAGPVLRGPPAAIHQHAGAVIMGGLMRLFMSIGVVGICNGAAARCVALSVKQAPDGLSQRLRMSQVNVRAKVLWNVVGQAIEKLLKDRPSGGRG